MRSTIIGIAFIVLSASAAIYAAVAPPIPRIEQPWNRITVEGLVEQEGGIQLFGAGRKQLYLKKPLPSGVIYWERLAFASDADYNAALLNVGQLVRVDAYVTNHGENTHLVPITIQLKTK